MIRHLATRDSGASTLTIGEYVEGEAETVSNLQKAPRCRFNIVYHNRLYQWGNDLFLDRAHASPLNRLDEYAGLWLGTLNGEKIVGAVVVRDTLVFFTPRSSYSVVGYGPSDLKMKILEPGVGCINHFGIRMIDDVAIIPTHRGLYLCTGTSLIPLNGGYENLWAEKFSENPTLFENGFAINDTVAGVYKYFADGRYWVFDYKSLAALGVNPAVPPLLSFDTGAPSCAEMLSGQGRVDCYTAESGIIYIENRWPGKFNGSTDPGHIIIQPAMVTEDGGGVQYGMTLHELWLFLSNFRHDDETDTERREFALQILNGNEWAACVRDGDNTTQFLLGVTVSEGGYETTGVYETPEGAGVAGEFFPQALVFTELNLAGEGFSPRISQPAQGHRLVYRGFGMNVSAGKKALHPCAPVDD